MKIKLENNFYIEVKEHTYDLVEDTGKVTNKTAKSEGGLPIMKNHGYHSTLNNAIKHYVRLNIIDNNEVMTLGSFVGEFERQVDRLESLAKGL